MPQVISIPLVYQVRMLTQRSEDVLVELVHQRSTHLALVPQVSYSKQLSTLSGLYLGLIRYRIERQAIG